MANLKYFPNWFLSETENCFSQKSTSALTSSDQWLFCHKDVYFSARDKMWQKCVAREGGGGGGCMTLPYSFFLQNLENRPFVASHSRGTKPPFWSARDELGEDKEGKFNDLSLLFFLSHCILYSPRGFLSLAKG